jgi:hypothetical protein
MVRKLERCSAHYDPKGVQIRRGRRQGRVSPGIRTSANLGVPSIDRCLLPIILAFEARDIS